MLAGRLLSWLADRAAAGHSSRPVVAFAGFLSWIHPTQATWSRRVRIESIFLRGSERATRSAEKASKRWPDSPELTSLLVETLALNGQHVRARRIATTFLERTPNAAAVKLALASALAKSGEPEAARDLAESLIGQLVLVETPLELELCVLLYRLHWDNGKLETLLRTLVERTPDNHWAIMLLGQLLPPDNAERRELLERARNLWPDGPEGFSAAVAQTTKWRAD